MTDDTHYLSLGTAPFAAQWNERGFSFVYNESILHQICKSNINRLHKIINEARVLWKQMSATSSSAQEVELCSNTSLHHNTTATATPLLCLERKGTRSCLPIDGQSAATPLPPIPHATLPLSDPVIAVQDSAVSSAIEHSSVVYAALPSQQPEMAPLTFAQSPATSNERDLLILRHANNLIAVALGIVRYQDLPEEDRRDIVRAAALGLTAPPSRHFHEGDDQSYNK
ncbi:hypothetical protein PROFUN_08807 [Planoprotostelium fungivorum]|uniref:Uncharacterized protein n=1 Tax=Planoprotostelium fungivorum TaxID=1890364 RepID=A0A2P6MVU8_9EUKA|nr:hypothetical protein PROFUN_08807 [Planoprotostelium fungivorum]